MGTIAMLTEQTQAYLASHITSQACFSGLMRACKLHKYTCTDMDLPSQDQGGPSVSNWTTRCTEIQYLVGYIWMYFSVTPLLLNVTPPLSNITYILLKPSHLSTCWDCFQDACQTHLELWAIVTMGDNLWWNVMVVGWHCVPSLIKSGGTSFAHTKPI